MACVCVGFFFYCFFNVHAAKFKLCCYSKQDDRLWEIKRQSEKGEITRKKVRMRSTRCGERERKGTVKEWSGTNQPKRKRLWKHHVFCFEVGYMSFLVCLYTYPQISSFNIENKTTLNCQKRRPIILVIFLHLCNICCPFSLNSHLPALSSILTNVVHLKNTLQLNVWLTAKWE